MTPGRRAPGPSGSATPLGWAHGEYVKLCRSLEDGRVFDMPRHAWDRYVRQQPSSSRVKTWRLSDPAMSMPTGKVLRIACPAPAVLTWTSDRWASTQTTRTRDAGIGIYYADVPTEGIAELRARVNHVEPRTEDGAEIVFSDESM